jgi:hypothetical protein
MSDNTAEHYHTLTIKSIDDGWYSVTYKISDGFKNNVVMDQSTLVSFYALIGRVLRADHEKESEWSATVKGS